MANTEKVLQGKTVMEAWSSADGPAGWVKLPEDLKLFSLEACAVFLGWMAWTVMLHLILPGVKKVQPRLVEHFSFGCIARIAVFRQSG